MTFKKTMASVLSVSMLMGMAAMPLSSFAAESDQLDVASISDIQYQAGAADANGLILSKSAAMLDAAIAKINVQNPDVVLVTGDLTNDGSQASHNYVKGKLAEMEDADTQVYVVPGEKDVAKGGVNPAAITDSQFTRTYINFGYDSRIFDTASLSYVIKPKAGYQLLMLDSVGAQGKGVISKTWALNQLATAKTAGDFVIGAAHHPSIGRGSVESTLTDLVNTIKNLKDATGKVIYDGADPFIGLNLVNTSAFPYADMQALSDAGLGHIYTGHNYQVNTANGTTSVPATETDPAIPGTDWADYAVGSLVAASASVTNTVFDKTAEVKAVTTVDRIATLDGANVRDLVMAAQIAYTPTMVNEIIAKFMPVYDKLVMMFQNIAPKIVDALDFGAGLSGDITASVAKPAVKQTAADVLAILANRAKIDPVIAELKAGILSDTAKVGDKSIVYVLSDVAVQLQEDHSKVAPSLAPMVDGLKADPADISIASQAFKTIVASVAGEKTLAVVNEILDQKLTLTVIVTSSHTIRELLYAPVKYFAGLVTVDLWAIIDGIQPNMPDGTPVPPEAKPSAIAKPLILGTIMKTDGSKQTSAADLKTGLIAKSDDFVNLALRFGIGAII